MMRMSKNVGRKFRTAYSKVNRPKTSAPKPMSEDWRARNRAGETQAKNEFKKHMKDADSYVRRRDEFESSSAPRPAKKKADTTIIAGQRMKTRNAEKSFKYVGAYRQGGAHVSKKAMKSQGPKAVTDALKGQMPVKPKKLRETASRYDAEFGTPMRMRTEAYIQGIESGRTGQSMWSIHKNKNRANGY